jgi:antitoxin Xre/MbcA/ParS-like protein
MATAQTIRVPAPELFNPKSGRLDAARIASELNVPVTTIAIAIGRKAPGVRKHPDSSTLQSGLRRIYRIWVTLLELFAGNKAVARQFLNAPNRGLDRRAPIEFIEAGDLAPLEMYVHSMTARQPI